MLGQRLEGPPWLRPARGMGGALWIDGCRRSAPPSRGLIMISAGFPFAPPRVRVARRLAKLMGGGGRACAGTEPCCCGCCCSGPGGGGRGGCRADDSASAEGLAGRASGESARFCIGAPPDRPAMERREGVGPPAGLGLRPPARVTGCCVFGGGCRSSDGGAGGALTTLTDTVGVPTETMPAVLPRRCSMSSFCCCLMVSMERTCSIAAASSRGMGRPMTTGEIDLAESAAGVLTSVLIGCEMPLIVTRRFLLGEGLTAEGGGAAAAVARAADCGASCVVEGALREDGDGKSSCSVSSLIRTLRGDRRSLEMGEKERGRRLNGRGKTIRGGRALTLSPRRYRRSDRGRPDGSACEKGVGVCQTWMDDVRRGRQ